MWLVESNYRLSSSCLQCHVLQRFHWRISKLGRLRAKTDDALIKPLRELLMIIFILVNQSGYLIAIIRVPENDIRRYRKILRGPFLIRKKMTELWSLKCTGSAMMLPESLFYQKSFAGTSGSFCTSYPMTY